MNMNKSPQELAEFLRDLAERNKGHFSNDEELLIKKCAREIEEQKEEIFNLQCELRELS